LRVAVQGIKHQVYSALTSLGKLLHDSVAIVEQLAGW
jgi:hypothetical protein